MAKKGVVHKAEPKRMPQPADLRPLQNYGKIIKDAIFNQWVKDRQRSKKKAA